MFALGHKQTFRIAISMSALPPIADSCSAATGIIIRGARRRAAEDPKAR
jgi:hypothetical protein